MSLVKKIVLFAALCIFAVWFKVNFARIGSDGDWLIRFVLAVFFAAIILVRKKTSVVESEGWLYHGHVLIAGLTGAVLAVSGIIFGVHQFEWLGLVLLLYVCFRWGMPDRAGGDVALAFLLIYWIHPLPWQVFGRMQMNMQWLSVNGAEWLLHCINERVWADGILLHSSFRSFGVPEACSGMRTAVTVLLCMLGAGILMRLRWYELLVFLAIGLVQVLLLNIVRISFMVAWARNMPVAWADTFLHDTLGLFLMVSMVLVLLEASWWRTRRTRRERLQYYIDIGDVEAPDLATILPRFWQFFARWWIHAAVILVLLLGTSFMFYKRRPVHRATMIYDVVEGLIDSDLELAERGIDEALKLMPGRRDFHERKVHVLVLRGKAQEALDDLAGIKGELTFSESVMKSWALMSLGRVDEAEALIRRLPDDLQKTPQVAIIKAEYAAMRNRPDDVRDNVVLAARDHSNLERIRKLFLYMASHGMWQTIAEADRPDVAYKEFAQSLIAVQANINISKLGGAAASMRQALNKWPDEFRLLGNLFELAQKQPGGQWEEVFVRNLKKNLKVLDADRLASYIEYCFQLRRPDVAWLAYVRLKELDPKDPSLYMMPARYASSWFVFRRHHLGIKAVSGDDMIDTAGIALLLKDAALLKSVWASVPLIDEMLAKDLKGVSDRYMKMCLAELENRRGRNELNSRMYMMYPMVLALSGDYDRAHAMQDEVAEKFPEMARKSLLKHATFYAWERKWEESYEWLRRFNEGAMDLDMEAEPMLVNAMMHMNMGVCALDIADRLDRSFPESFTGSRLRGLIWESYGMRDLALFEYRRDEESIKDASVIQLIYNTGRFNTAENLARVHKQKLDRHSGVDGQALIVPAELAVAPIWPAPMTKADMDQAAVKIEERAAASKSPFFKAFYLMTAQWYRTGGAGDVSDPGKWVSIGRDNMEKTAALYQLALLISNREDRIRAVDILKMGLELMPRSPMLHRLLVAVSSGDRGFIDAARSACPADPEIWLSSVLVRCKGVTRGKEAELGEQLLKDMRDVTERRLFPSETYIRAADYLLRKGYVASSILLTKHVLGEEQDYLPAYVMGLRCALVSGDRKWAEKCALGGADSAQDPSPFFRVIVILKNSAREMDGDLIKALEYLREHFPKNLNWVEGLGYVYFQMGDSARAFSVFSPLLDDEKAGRLSVTSLMLAAEAARYEGRTADAVRILSTARRVYPKEFKLLNNLIYNMAQSPETLLQARQMLPELMEIAADEFVVLDTASMVYMRSGDLQRASEYMKRALAIADKNSLASLEIRVNSAELELRLGKPDQAREILTNIKGELKRSDMLQFRAADLLRKIEEAGKAGGR